MRPTLLRLLPALLAPAIAIFAALALSGCAIVYRLPIKQGNVISQKDLQKVHLGMTHDQVQYALGTPLASSPFDNSRWEYVSYYKSRRGSKSERKVSLLFQDDKLTKMIGVNNKAAAKRAEEATQKQLQEQRESEQNKPRSGPRRSPGPSTGRGRPGPRPMGGIL